ncbi:MAG: M48 family metalloprotease [Gammaproteobacteria bacterium]|jgi:Zn-dependent protease with chaperone function|nr:M48 family metalloprotease [Gammaproteobacteria bacterium]
MNFFEHQDKARRQSRWLVFLFALAVLAIVAAVDALVFFTVGPDPVMLFWATLVTGGIILGASAIRTLQLRGGGGDVAQAMGGTLIESSPSDPLRRRLRNVVEEMAIASGVPVPEIYVLEHEQGINAFAAGFSPADAAVAVTRGTLEHLDRDELQGVIAHEFSHILNGDMRLNIRLIGFVFGILVIAIFGRKLLFSGRFARDSRNAAPLVGVGLAIVVIGYIGLFFGRWIKAAVSRQREFLADASAVQFTRNPDGIGNALKKIGALYAGSYLSADSEEIGHMLFSTGMSYQFFATHPPIEKRILSVDPSFEPAEFERIGREMDRHARARKAEAEEAERRQQAAEAAQGIDPARLATDLGGLAEQIGQPGLEQVLTAAVLAASIPAPLERAAHSDEWARELICCLLIGEDAEVRERQLLQIARSLGSGSEEQVRQLFDAVAGQPRSVRLPLVEMAFPQIRRRPEAELLEFMRLLESLARADGEIELHEFALTRLVNALVRDALRPAQSKSAGGYKLAARRREATELMAVLAQHGHPGDAAGAEAAFAAGMSELAGEVPPMPQLGAWAGRLDQLLARLDALRPASKHSLVVALLRCAAYDDAVVDDELDLLRVICALLHVPLPLMQRGSSTNGPEPS